MEISWRIVTLVVSRELFGMWYVEHLDKRT